MRNGNRYTYTSEHFASENARKEVPQKAEDIAKKPQNTVLMEFLRTAVNITRVV